MSSKRYSAMKNFARAKKPKLDISVSRGRPVSPKRETNIGNSTQASADLRKNDIDVDFWDDDDDDVILMATQLAEAAEAVRKTDENTMTFTQFSPKGGTSTQGPSPPPPVIEKNCLLVNSEDFEFEAPILTFIAPSDANDPGPSNYSQKTTEARRQLAQERQIKFLMERLDLIKKDNIKLKKELSDSNDVTKVKSGEVSLLRDELRHVRQQLQATKMEKLALADQKAVVEAKHISVNEAVLKLKYAEVRSVKLNQAKAANDIKNYYKQEGRSLPRHFLSMPKLEIQAKAASELSLASNTYPNIYKQDPIRNIEIKKSLGSRVGALFKADFDQLLINYAQLEKKQLTKEYEHLGILNSVCKVFSEFWSYAHNLESLPNRQVYPYVFYPLLGGNQRSLHDLYQPLPLYRGERFVFLRRYLALLSLMCSHNRAIAEALLHLKHGQVSLLQIVSDSIKILGFSQDLPEHFGLLEGFGAFLTSLLRNAFGASSPDVLNPLFDLLKQLVFTRPSPWVFGQLSSCMLACSQKAAWPNLMSQMCVNSPKTCFISDRVRSIYRFGTDSCLVQVYAGLIELCFFNALPLEPSHFQLLLSTCRNHVDFVYQCFQNPPDFILKMLPSLGDAEDDDEMAERTAIVGGSAIASSVISVGASDYNSTLEKAEKSAAPAEECSCECYVKLCLSVVTLVFQLMHQWILKGCKTDTEEVGKISQTAVHLLKLIFRENYLTCLFRDSEETTKHYLSLICNWWTEHAKCLGFLRIHVRFLRQLEYSHFMSKPMILEANEKNPELDLTEWNRTANTSEDVNLNEIDFYNYMIGIDDFFSEIERMEEYHFE
ncbi:uncharacterized protein Dwil_GK21090 [Drosophila willistoni]|uniref:ATR-interacting protein mus304 n=1 Tax=Drosophila willistoni TaxID=7260 RepID=B4N780_DROWI|nr:uncharacterized protein Dwil_GK21090 [Drosophila willistoni]